MLRGRIAGIGVGCLFLAAIVAAAGACSDDAELVVPAGSGGALGIDASADATAGGDTGLGGTGAAGGSEAGQTDTAADADWNATCAAAMPPPGLGSCLWACGCQQCAKVTAECLANDACKAIIDCSIQQGCTNEPDAGASSCQVKCAKIISDNFTAGGMRASAFDRCATTSCKLACVPDSGAPDGPATPDAPLDSPPDAPPDSPADATIIDVVAEVAPIDAPKGDAVVDATADSVADASEDGPATDSPAEADAPDGAPADGGDADAD
jgi:hypothetical protein